MEVKYIGQTKIVKRIHENGISKTFFRQDHKQWVTISHYEKKGLL